MWRKAACGAGPSTASSCGSRTRTPRETGAMPPPLRWCHLDGQLIELAAARISPFDRSFLFGDGIYEVIPVYGGRLFRPGLHLERLARSAAALQLPDPHTPAAWQALLETLVQANGGSDQYIYLHLSRGAEEGRNHAPLPA